MRPKAYARAAVLTLTALLGAACAGPPDGPVESVSGQNWTSTTLRRAALEPGDVPGYAVSGDRSPDAARDAPIADRAACAPLAEVMGEAPDDRARATVSRGLGSRKTPGLAAVFFMRWSYSSATAGHESPIPSVRAKMASDSSVIPRSSLSA